MNDVPEARETAELSGRPSVAEPGKPYHRPEITPLGSLIDLTLSSPPSPKANGPSDGVLGSRPFA